jgi:Ribosomal protein L5
MATKEKKQGKKREVQEQVQVEHTGKDLPVPPPRLRIYYENTVRDRLKSQFGFTNVHEIPTLEKIVINCGVGEAIKNPKVLDKVVNELGIITGQRPTRKKAKKSIANFGLREGQEIGCAVTLRGARMWGSSTASSAWRSRAYAISADSTRGRSTVAVTTRSASRSR